MNEEQICAAVLDIAFIMHKDLGPGLLESVYETILEKMLGERGLGVVSQFPVSFSYGGIRFDEGFQADLLIGEKVIVELKSVQSLQPVHAKQLMTYLKLSGCRMGLLINFNEALLKNGIKRIVNGYEGPSRPLPLAQSKSSKLAPATIRTMTRRDVA